MNEAKKNRVPEFRSRLNKLRGELSQEEFAKKIGISRQTLGLYENGDRIPDIEVLAKISKALDVSCDYLVGKTNYKTHTAAAIGEVTGLSEKSINALYQMKCNADVLGICAIDWLPVINALIENESDNNGNGILTLINQYLYSAFEYGFSISSHIGKNYE